jgi:hypothetical protein
MVKFQAGEWAIPRTLVIVLVQDNASFGTQNLELVRDLDLVLALDPGQVALRWISEGLHFVDLILVDLDLVQGPLHERILARRLEAHASLAEGVTILAEEATNMDEGAMNMAQTAQ